MGENQLECRLTAVTQQLSIYGHEKKELMKAPWGWGPDIKTLNKNIKTLKKEQNMLLRELNRIEQDPPEKRYYINMNYKGPEPTLEEVHHICQLWDCKGQYHEFVTYQPSRGVLTMCHNGTMTSFFVPCLKVKHDGRLDKKFNIRETATPTVVHPARIPEA